MLIENNLREDILEAEAYALAERNLSFEDSYVFELQQVYRHTDFRLHRISVQVGKTIRPYSFELVSPPSGARLLWRVILLPEGDTFGHSRGFTLTPSSYVLPLITQSSTGRSYLNQIVNRATGRNRHKILSHSFTNTSGQVTLNYPICAGETFKLQNNNSYPVFCVLCYEIKDC